MVSSPFIVVLDANVLFPFTLRDTLLRAAQAGFFQAKWSAEILDEMTRNLVSTGAMPKDKADRLRTIMTSFFPDAEVSGYQALTSSMQNDPRDRHVSAAAVAAGAQVIVTANLRDFTKLPAHIEAQSPDEFLENLFDLAPDPFVELLRQQAEDLRAPHVTFETLLAHLERVVPNTVAVVREHVALAP